MYLIEAQEKDVDLRLVVDAPGVHSEAEDDVPRHGVLHKVVGIRSPGEIRITLRNADHSTKKGLARVSIARWQRAADAPPGELELGFTALAAAEELTAEKSPATGQEAVDAFQEAVNHFATVGAVAERALAQYTLANFLYSTREDNPAAIRAAEGAVSGFESLNDAVGLRNALTLRAAAQLEVASGMDSSRQDAEQHAMYRDADRELRVSAEYFNKHEMPVREAYSINMRGIRALYVGEYEAAENFFSQAIEMARANQDVGETARYLSNLAWIHNRRGFVVQAASEYEALLPMLEKERQPYQYGITIGNYGLCLVLMGEFDRALALHNQALALFTTRGNEAERANELNALGSVYLRIGDTGRALEMLRTAAATQERVPNRIGQAASLRMAGNAASAERQHSEALALLRKAIEIEANPVNVARTRVLIAAELREMGDLHGAEAELANALKSSNAVAHADALGERGRLRIAQGNPVAAIADLRAADREFLTHDLDYSRIRINTALSRALLVERDVPAAAAAADEAVAITERIRVKSANPEWRARFLSSRYAPYEARIAVDFAMGGPDAAWRAFHTAERVRARSLADQVAAGPNRPPSDLAAAELRAKLTSLQLRLESRTQKAGASDSGTLELRAAVDEARAQVDANRAGVAAQEPQLPTSLKGAQQALPRDTAVLAYFVGDVESHGWLLTRDTLRHKILPGQEDLRRAVESSVASMQRTAPGRDASRVLGNLLLAGLLEGANASRLLLIPDGPLHGAPFSALAMPGTTNGDLLVDHFSIASAPSLTLALMPRAPSAIGQPVIAIVADPVYSPNDHRLTLAAEQVRQFDRRSASEFVRLTYSAVEARSVITAFADQKVIELNGFDATASRVMALPADRLGILHFATHAAARDEYFGGSALFLTSYSTRGEQLASDRLTLDDIARSSLRAKLVVLSGCSTGAGDELRGEGVLGLAYGFLANGSGAVVASLRPVEDAFAAQFMEHFYAAYRKSGNAADALRMAQLRMRGTASPAAWSSFVVRTSGFP